MPSVELFYKKSLILTFREIVITLFERIFDLDTLHAAAASLSDIVSQKASVCLKFIGLNIFLLR